MSDYKWLDERALDPEKPSDAFVLNRLLDNTEAVYALRGNHVGYNWDVRTVNPNSGHIRPFCSVTRPLTILRVPYFVSAGLDRIEAVLLCRVSNANLDAGETIDYSDLAVGIRLFLESDSDPVGATRVTPQLNVAGEAEWQIVKISYQVGPELLSQFGGVGGMTYLNLEIKSRTPATKGDRHGKSPAFDVPYILSYFALDSNSGGDYFKSQQSGFFAEGAPGTAPAPAANETVCLGIIRAREVGVDYHTVGIYDPVYRWPSVDNQAMRVAGEPIVYADDMYGAKMVASYIQPINLQLHEVYR